MKKIRNVKVLNFFDQKGTLTTLQSGSRAKQTTNAHLLSLEVAVGKTKQTNSDQVLSSFRHAKSIQFNMETQHSDGTKRNQNTRKNSSPQKKKS